jgi:hypothetical protein
MRFFCWLLLIPLALVSSCEKPIEFAPRNPEPKLVVDASIESGAYPVVYLSRSLNFFSSISFDQLANSFVRGAQVQLSNGTQTYPLREYEIPLADGYSIYYYSFDTLNPSASFRGVEGETYTLTIEADGQQYSASTLIPEFTKTLDSLYVTENVDRDDSSKVVLYGKFTDPPGFGNYTRYFTSVNGNPYYPGLNSVYDDQVIDGKSYTVQIEQGVDRNSEIDFEEYSYFRKGDNIRVKFCNIDKSVFDFWRTMEYSYSSIGNPFSSPTKVQGNISNGALGYFGGYAVQYLSIYVPE